MSEDERLLRAASRGDARAFEDLVRSLAPGMYAFMCGMLGDEHEAEDAMQETFVRAARALEGHDGRSPLVGWIYGIARRVALTHPSAAPQPEGGPVRAMPPGPRELVVCRDLLGWDVATIAEALGVTPEEAHARLASARDHLLPAGVWDGGDAAAGIAGTLAAAEDTKASVP